MGKSLVLTVIMPRPTAVQNRPQAGNSPDGEVEPGSESEVACVVCGVLQSPSRSFWISCSNHTSLNDNAVIIQLTVEHQECKNCSRARSPRMRRSQRMSLDRDCGAALDWRPANLTISGEDYLAKNRPKASEVNSQKMKLQRPATDNRNGALSETVRRPPEPGSTRLAEGRKLVSGRSVRLRVATKAFCGG